MDSEQDFRFLASLFKYFLLRASQDTQSATTAVQSLSIVQAFHLIGIPRVIDLESELLEFVLSEASPVLGLIMGGRFIFFLAELSAEFSGELI
jgi:hypothetical protein